jgi:uncharacterized protein (TIGR02246 family)
MDALQRLLIQDACRELVLRAVECTDAHDAAGLAALFTPDGVLSRPGGQALVGRAAIEAAYAQRPRERITRHLVTNTRVVVESGSAATGRSLVLLWAARPRMPKARRAGRCAARSSWANSTTASSSPQRAGASPAERQSSCCTRRADAAAGPSRRALARAVAWRAAFPPD